ncbi:MAG: transglutaminase domain-containing protein, partial [Planctomycetales bacterium]|nr:transglutaminase domain-containing protein [Planctomycetales bacterium]
MRRYSLLVIIAVAGIAGGFAGPRIIVVYGQPAPSPSTAQLDANDIAAVDWWQAHPDLHRALHDAGDNRNELERFLAAVPEAQRDGARFLVQYMPLHDLTALKAPYLLENIELAYRAKREFPWGKSIPDEIFFNDVLPYANINESRDDWRRDFWDRFAPVVRDCRTASEAAQRLNEKVFATLNVRYSTQRRRADQGPQESIETGLASCTGLSILLVDACRAVGIPARLVGIPEWVNKRGNHTWVEMWDEKWHFTGACEPDQRGLNYAWFQHDASLALAEDWRHSIYAASYKHTG